MPTEPRPKKSFGTCYSTRIQPTPGEGVPKNMVITISFEEALKLHLAIGQALAKLNSYNRSTKAGRRSAVKIGLYAHDNYITVEEGKLPRDESPRRRTGCASRLTGYASASG
jgi:hypothetical protein